MSKHVLVVSHSFPPAEQHRRATVWVSHSASRATRLGVMNRVHILQPCSPGRVADEADRAVANLVLDDVADTHASSRGVLKRMHYSLAQPLAAVWGRQLATLGNPYFAYPHPPQAAGLTSSASEIIHQSR